MIVSIDRWSYYLFLMITRPPRSTRTDTLFPYTTLFRSTIGLAKALSLRLDLPSLVVPTTYAGSEVTPIWGLTQDGVKTTGWDRKVLPKVVIYDPDLRSEEHTFELQSLMRISYAVFCLKNTNNKNMNSLAFHIQSKN